MSPEPNPALIEIDRFGAAVAETAKGDSAFRVLVVQLGGNVSRVQLTGHGIVLATKESSGSIMEFDSIPVLESNDYTIQLFDRNNTVSYTSPSLQLWAHASCG